MVGKMDGGKNTAEGIAKEVCQFPDGFVVVLRRRAMTRR